MRRVVFVLTMFAFIAAAQGVFASYTEKYFIDASVLNVRKEPNSQSEVLGKMQKDTQIEFLENTGIVDKIDTIYASWIKIRIGNGVGYVFGGYVNRKITYDNGFDNDQKIFVITLNPYSVNALPILPDVNIYEFPSVSSRIVASPAMAETLQCDARAYTEESIRNRYFWYHVGYKGREGFVQGDKISADYYIDNGYCYGVNEYPIDMESPDEHRYVQTNSNIVVVSLAKRKIVQRFTMPDQTDRVSFIRYNNFADLFGKNVIIIKHIWNHFTCCPIGYEGNIVYSLGEDGKIGDKVFTWFKEIGAQDSPWASLKNMKIAGDSITLKYEYYQSIGMPSFGHGDLVVKYSVDKKKISSVKIESTVTQTHQIVNGSFSSDDEHKLANPVILQLDKKKLNSNFLYMGKDYSFVY